MKHTISTLTRGLLLVLGLALGTPFHAQADESTVRVMSYNIYRGGEMLGQPLSQTVKVIQEAKADIVGVQEMRSPKGNNTERLAGLLGWNFHVGPRHDTILTRYEIVEGYKGGIKVKLPSGQDAYIFNLHLPSHPYQPYQLLGIRPKWHKHWDLPFLETEEEAVAAAKDARGGLIANLLQEIDAIPDKEALVFVVGDFNEPSHLDWTEAAAKSGRHPIKVAYPTSSTMAQAGFHDAYRTIYPDEMAKPGFTWPPTKTTDDPTTHLDRIDFVYFKGKDIELTEAKIVGENEEMADIVVSPYPSDHRAVVATFTLAKQPSPVLGRPHGELSGGMKRIGDSPAPFANKPDAAAAEASGFAALDWKRPVDNPVFTSTFGNNHDSVLFVEPELEYPYHLIISHTPEAAHLWRAKTFSWSSDDWELVSDQYKIGNHYEYDDGVKVDGTYYLYEEGIVYTYSGPLEEASGKWKAAGTFPHKQCDDIGIYYEDGVFHMFGEHGNFPHGPDGTSLAHFSSTTGLGDWTLVNAKAVDPNPNGGHTYGVGDATIAKIDGQYYIFCDRESKGSPYKVVAWRSKDINAPFEYLGKAITPRSDEVDDWDNHRIQDPDIAYIPELGGHVMTCNMMDRDGNPGGNFPTLRGKMTRVIGVFYHGSARSAQYQIQKRPRVR